MGLDYNSPDDAQENSGREDEREDLNAGTHDDAEKEQSNAVLRGTIKEDCEGQDEKKDERIDAEKRKQQGKKSNRRRLRKPRRDDLHKGKTRDSMQEEKRARQVNKREQWDKTTKARKRISKREYQRE